MAKYLRGPRISNLKSADSVLNWLWINGKTIKTPGFYENAHLYICSICLRQYGSSLTETQYCRLNQVTREPIPMKIWCLKCFTCKDSSDEQNAFDGLKKIIICAFTNFLSLQLNGFLGYCSPHFTQIVSSAWLYFLLESTTEEKKS